MKKEYKILTFTDSRAGRSEMADEIQLLSEKGWELKSKEVASQGWSFWKTLIWGIIFLPLALLGKKSNLIQVILEREKP